MIAAIAECEAVCEQVHLPLQSGSSRILKAMRRTYTRERYLALVERLRAAIPDLALGTDIIVGFPGETEADFARRSRSSRRSATTAPSRSSTRRAQGTEAAAMEEQVPHEVKIERMERLVELVAADRARAERRARRPRRGGARRGPVAHRRDAALRGRTRRNTTVNFSGSAEPGELVAVRIEPATSTTLRGTEEALSSAVSGRVRPMNVLVTGSSGQIGTNLALRLLADGHSVFGVDKRPEYLDARVRDAPAGPGGPLRAVPRRHRTGSSTPRSTSSSTSPRMRRCTSSFASRSARSRTR